MSESPSSESNAPTEKKSKGRLLVLVGFVVVLGVVSAIVNLAFPDPAQPGQGAAPAGDGAPPAAVEPDIIEHEGYTLLKDEGNAYYDVTDALVDPKLLFGNTTRSTSMSIQNVTFSELSAADKDLQPESTVIVVKVDGETRLYPMAYLGFMQLINDTVAGQPILIYISGVSRSIGGVYDRRIGENVHTFGFTSHRIKDADFENENETFLLWDVETESIWFPLIGKAITGQMKGTRLKWLDESLWGYTSWADAKQRYPDATVLVPLTHPEPKHYVRPVRSLPNAPTRTFVAHDAADAWPAVLDSQADIDPDAEHVYAPDYNSNRTLPE